MSFKLASTEQEYEKNQDLKREDVEALVEWLKKQPHLPNLTELQVILFLHSCYYRIEAAKVAIDDYFTIRTHCPEIFECPSEDVLQYTTSTNFTGILPKQTPEGYSILVMRLIDSRPENYNCVNQVKLITMVLAWHFHQYGTSNGLVVLFDMKGSSLGHVARINLTAMKQLLHHVQEGAPIRIKDLHVLNVVPFTNTLINMLKPFMKKEFVEMLKFHPTPTESLHNYFPKDCIPNDYGGEGPSIQDLQENNTKNLLDNLDFFKWHDTQKVDESKRQGKPKNINTLFGVDGTFKKLEID